MANILTTNQIITGLKNAGWSDADIPTAFAIIQAESGGDADAKNTRSTATGLFQVMWSVWKDDNDIKKAFGNPVLLDRNAMTDPAGNLKAGLVIRNKQGWSAWTTYTGRNASRESAAAWSMHVNQAKNGLAAYNSGTREDLPSVYQDWKDGSGAVGDAVDAVDGGGNGFSFNGILDNFNNLLARIASNGAVLILAVVFIILGIVILARGTVMSAVTGGVTKQLKAVTKGKGK